jgi:hypothetical protein
MKTAAIKFLTSNGARIKVALASGIVWLITQGITRLGLDIGSDWSAQISVYAALAAGWVLESITAKISTDGIKKIQEILPPEVKVDGHAGPMTTGVLKQIVRENGEVAAPLTIEEKTAVFKTAEPQPPTP